MLFATFCGLPLICYVILSFYCMILHSIIHILSVHYKFLQLCKLSRIFSFFVIFNMLILYIPLEEGGLNLVHYNAESFKIFPSVFLKNAYLTFWRRYLYSTSIFSPSHTLPVIKIFQSVLRPFLWNHDCFDINHDLI